VNFLNALGTRFRMADPQHAAIFRGMLTVALFTMLGKLMSAAKEMAVAYRYGLAAEVDAYQFLFNLVAWPVGVWTSVLTAVLVPLAARVRARDNAALPRFRAELLGFALLLGCVLAVAGGMGIHAMLALGMSGLPPTSLPLARSALPGLILLLPLGLLVALQSAWMLAARRHVNTLLECVPPLFIATAILAVPGGGLGPLVWGTVVGGMAHLLSLMLPMARRGQLEAPAFTRDSAQWQWFWKGFGIMLGGQALLSFTVIIDQFYAVGLGTGAIATLAYANRVLSLILGLAAIAVARATLPVFSESASAGAGSVHGVAIHWARLMFGAGIVVMLVSHAMAPWAIRLLFERGEFLPGDARVVAEALRYGLPQLPFYFSAMVLVSYALSQRRYGLIFWSGVIGCAGKIIGNLILVPILGVNGIALAATVVYAANALFFALSLRTGAGVRKEAHGDAR